MPKRFRQWEKRGRLRSTSLAGERWTEVTVAQGDRPLGRAVRLGVPPKLLLSGSPVEGGCLFCTSHRAAKFDQLTGGKVLMLEWCGPGFKSCLHQYLAAWLGQEAYLSLGLSFSHLENGGNFRIDPITLVWEWNDEMYTKSWAWRLAHRKRWCWELLLLLESATEFTVTTDKVKGFSITLSSLRGL